MVTTIFYTVITLCLSGILFAIILYLVSQKFKIVEDPRIDEVEKSLPGVNCGGCGYPGCRNFATACVEAKDLTSLYCPVGGNDCMANVAKVLGKAVTQRQPLVAVVRCGGSHDKRHKTNIYDGAKDCAIVHMSYGGDTGCSFGCLSLGDCVTACQFDAIAMNPITGLPVVVEEKCIACGACVVACPKKLIELRKKGPRGMRVFVCCMNEEKGNVAQKVCQVACIGCGACVKICPVTAITLENCLAYIDFDKCTLCRKCVDVCPTHAIQETNFPTKKKTETNKIIPEEKS